jgi:CarboxypepD_reg-like domain/TonB-dependent Receptor Plug Domain
MIRCAPRHSPVSMEDDGHLSVNRMNACRSHRTAVADRTDPASVRKRVGRALALVLLAVFSLITCPRVTHAQTAVVQGQVVDSETREPIEGVLVSLSGTSLKAVTDSRGIFAIAGVRAGAFSVSLSHIAYGEKSTDVTVEQGEPVSLRIFLSKTAIRLEEMSVEALTGQDLGARGQGFRAGRVSREQIAVAQGTTMGMADVLRQFVPSVRIRRMDNVVGTPTCIELRASRAMGADSGCLSPAVYLDGVPVNNPTVLYGSLSLEMIESMEVVPAAESGVRFGSGALYGALLIETRRPGAVRPRAQSGLQVFDWAIDQQAHPANRAFAYSFIGNILGLATGMALARECIGIRRPADDSIVAKCSALPTAGTALAAISLPAVGGALGARLGGQTHMSRGMLLPASLGAAMALVPGYALAFTSDRENSDVLGVVAGSLLMVGVPFLQTLSDKLFRSIR